MKAKLFKVFSCGLLLISMTGMSNIEAESNMKKFKWQATEGAPTNYPMQIVSGSLLYQDGSGSLYVPAGATLHNGWGKGRSSHVVGDALKPLPDRLSITFFSYTENQFYEGKFDLPYEKILSMFQAGFYSPNQEKEITYNNIIVGVAPGGTVSVWLWGYEKKTEIFSGQAEKADTNWNRLTSATHISRDQYVREVVEESLKTPDAIASLHNNGVPIGLWDSYRTRYHWQPVFTGMPLLDDRIRLIKYFNGEQDYLDYPLEKELAASTRAVPSYMSFIWEFAPGKGRLFELTFDETEIFDVFKKLAKNNQPLQLVLLMEKIDGQNLFSSALSNDKESIKLKRTNIETYSTRDREVESTR